MKKEIQQFLDYPDDKLEKMRNMYVLSCCLSVIALLMMTGFFFFFLFLQKNTMMAILFLFVLLTVITGSIFSRQTLRYIEIVQELKQIKSNKKNPE